MRTKIIKTAVVLLGVICASMVLLAHVGSIIWFVYLSLLISIFFWGKKGSTTPLELAAIIPILELMWIVVLSKNNFGGNVILHNIKTLSVFYAHGGFPGYIIWCLILPLAFHKLSHIWG